MDATTISPACSRRESFPASARPSASIVSKRSWKKPAGSRANRPLFRSSFRTSLAQTPRSPCNSPARLRKVGIGAEVFPEPIQIGKQMGYGSSRGHRFAVIVGPDEQEKQVFNLRDLATRQERKIIPWSDLEIVVQDAIQGRGSVGVAP